MVTRTSPERVMARRPPGVDRCPDDRGARHGYDPESTTTVGIEDARAARCFGGSVERGPGRTDETPRVTGDAVGGTIAMALPRSRTDASAAALATRAEVHLLFDGPGVG